MHSDAASCGHSTDLDGRPRPHQPGLGRTGFTPLPALLYLAIPAVTFVDDVVITAADGAGDAVVTAVTPCNAVCL